MFPYCAIMFMLGLTEKFSLTLRKSLNLKILKCYSILSEVCQVPSMQVLMWHNMKQEKAAEAEVTVLISPAVVTRPGPECDTPPRSPVLRPAELCARHCGLPGALVLIQG